MTDASGPQGLLIAQQTRRAFTFERREPLLQEVSEILSAASILLEIGCFSIRPSVLVESLMRVGSHRLEDTTYSNWRSLG
jgi:hypothetical protein